VAEPEVDERAGLVEPLRSRWSPSVFDPDHVVTPAEVTLLLRAAQWAPSTGNSQPWRYVVAPRGGAAHAALLPHLSRGNSGWVPRASLVLLAGAQVAPDPDGPEGNGPKSPRHARYDLGQASAYITVQAASLGLHVHQFAGFDHAATAADLGVPNHVELMAGLAVGRHLAGPDDRIDEADRDRERRPRVRRGLAEIAFGPRWGEAWTG
jgi:nitroreductase